MLTRGCLTCFQATTSSWVSTGQHLEQERTVHFYPPGAHRCGLPSSFLSLISFFSQLPIVLPQNWHHSQVYDLYQSHGIRTSNGISDKGQKFSLSLKGEGFISLSPCYSHQPCICPELEKLNSSSRCYFSHFNYSIPVRICRLGSESIAS